MPWGPIKEHDGSGVPREVQRRLTRMFFDPKDNPEYLSAEEVVDQSTWAPPTDESSWHWTKGFCRILRYQVHESRYANKILETASKPVEENV